MNIVTRTKIVLPHRRADMLSRQRLLDRLYNDLPYSRLIAITAPAGYGKTSLLIDFAHHTELPVCWYTIDLLDNDPQRFIAHFIAAIAHRFPEFGRQSAAVLESTTLDNSGLVPLVTTIVNEAYEHIQEHFILVLDDYHFVNEDKTIKCFIDLFMRQVDENFHLIVSSRTLLNIDLILLVARGQAGGLGVNELAFEAGEIQELFLKNYGLTLPETAAEELVKETEGWITGLLMSAQTMWRGMVDRLRLARASGIELYDYLAQQVFEQQSPAVQDFLLRTSLLEEFDADLCQAVLGPAEQPDGIDCSDLMDTVVRNNLFVLPVDDMGTCLRYHHLFQDFLQERMEARRPAEKVRILRRLATVYAEREAWEKAHDLYQRLDDTEATADLIERAGLSMVRGGRFTILAQWLDALPTAILTSRSFLLSLRGIAAVTLGEVESGLSLLNQSEAIAWAEGDRPGLARALVWRAVAHRFLANYQASLADAEKALVLTKGDGALGIIRAEALRAKGISLYHIGRLNETLEWLEQSLAEYDAFDEVQNVAILLLELGMVYRVSGAYTSAEAAYNKALDHWRATNNVTWQANLLNNLGVLFHLKGDYEQAVMTLEEALVCAKRSGYARIEALALTSIGDLYADLGAAEAALLAYRRARKTADRFFLLLYLNLAEAALARLQGDLAQAHDLLDSAWQLAQESDSDYERGLCHLEAGRLALTEGLAPEAITQLEEATRCFDRGGQCVEAIRASLFLADAYHAIGDQRATLVQLEHTFYLAHDLESHYALVVAGQEVKAMLDAVHHDPAIGPLAARLLKQITQFEQDIPILRRRLRRQTSVVPFAQPKLIIQALGESQVFLNGKVLTNTDWQAKVARDLFLFLLAHPDGKSKEEIGAIFWPDNSPSQLKLQFKNTIYRLRRALESEVVLFDEDTDCYRFNQALDYEYDVETFWKTITQAQIEPSPDQQMATYQRAVRLYKGDYLPDVDGIWIWPERERLRNAYLEAMLKVARFHLETGHYETALDYCRTALAKDPCLEAVHRLAMRAYAAMGNQVAIVRQFHSCQKSLLEEVNTPPSPKTENLYHTLIY